MREIMERGGSIENKTLLYSRVADRIYQYIKEENLQPGEKLPGERKLAEEWKVSRSTLREAIRELENEGIVHVEVGKGTFVTDYVEGRQVSIHLALKNFLELFSDQCFQTYRNRPHLRCTYKNRSRDQFIPCADKSKYEYRYDSREHDRKYNFKK